MSHIALLDFAVPALLLSHSIPSLVLPDRRTAFVPELIPRCGPAARQSSMRLPILIAIAHSARMSVFVSQSGLNRPMNSLTAGHLTRFTPMTPTSVSAD